MNKYISLFSGAGGLDVGLERAGLEPVSFCEIEPAFCESLKANSGWVHEDGKIYFKNAKIINSDIREVKSKELSGENEIDLIVGGPPCQSFSSSGKQLSVLDPRGALLREFYRFIEEIQPKMFLFENVRGLVTARDKKGVPGGVITDLIHILEEIGYSVRAGLLNSADYGSYQRRVRCFLIGSKKGLAPLFPEPTHSKEENLLSQKWLTLRDFLNRYEDTDETNYVYPTESLKRQIEHLPNGSGLKSLGKQEATRPGGHWGYRQGTFIADLELPARTVTGSQSQDWIRWNESLRRLTLKEIILLQGFPNDWILKGNKANQFKQIGNAVPTIFGEILGNTIKKHLDSFPTNNPEKIKIPESFNNYIEYTKKDHERNKASRQVHLQFTN